MAGEIPRPPQDVLDLFAREETKDEGRTRAIEWLQGIAPSLEHGDKVLMPHPSTGELMQYSKGEFIH